MVTIALSSLTEDIFTKASSVLSSNSQTWIVTGPNRDIAIKLIKRIKGLFKYRLGVTLDSRETVLELNGFSIEHILLAIWMLNKHLTIPKFILSNEINFFRKSEQEDKPCI